MECGDTDGDGDEDGVWSKMVMVEDGDGRRW